MEKNTKIILVIILIVLALYFGKNLGLFGMVQPCNENTVFEDSWVDENRQGEEHGDSSILIVHIYDGGNPENPQWAYLKFKIPPDIISAVKSGTKLDRATIYVWVSYVSDAGYIDVHGTSNSWTENTVNWGNKPIKEELLLSNEHIGTTQEDEYIALTGMGAYIEQKIKGGATEVSFIIKPNSAEDNMKVWLSSKEGGSATWSCNTWRGSYITGNEAPYLKIEYTPPECIYGKDTKCVGMLWYTCDATGKWKEEGMVVGKCGYYTEPLQLGPNQLVVMESFSGGSTISKTSTRYPVIVWGGSLLPVIVVDSRDNSVSTDPTIYKNLSSGQAIQIPTYNVYSLFYVIENNYQLPTICNVVDVKTGNCAQINPGIVTACSEGQFDPSLGLCVVQPESRIICEFGRYDTSQGVCIYNPPIAYLCPQDGKPWVYNVNSGKCEYSPPQEYVC